MDHHYFLDENNSLIITEAEVEDAGSFLCVVENPADVVSKEFTVTILGESQAGCLHDVNDVLCNSYCI